MNWFFIFTIIFGIGFLLGALIYQYVFLANCKIFFSVEILTIVSPKELAIAFLLNLFILILWFYVLTIFRPILALVLYVWGVTLWLSLSLSVSSFVTLPLPLSSIPLVFANGSLLFVILGLWFVLHFCSVHLMSVKWLKLMLLSFNAKELWRIRMSSLLVFVTVCFFLGPTRGFGNFPSCEGGYLFMMISIFLNLAEILWFQYLYNSFLTKIIEGK